MTAPGTMIADDRDVFLKEIESLLRETTESMRPSALWITEHAQLPRSAHDLITPVVAAWYRDDRGCSRRPAEEFVRFINAQSGSFTGYPTSSSVFNSRPGRIHDIGLAGFAATETAGLYCFEWQFGGTFGRGQYCRITEAGELIYEKNLWVS